uniref:NUCLEAR POLYADENYLATED RNA-BINDING PROTEIN NAB2 n=1 Tax=Saccharomyces cerevisiae TaxID=4932 RepID=UPI000392CFE6
GSFTPTKKEGRCRLFPHCPLGRSCPHAHPTKVCNEYPNCPKPPGTCEFLHPNEDEELMKEMERTREEFQKRKADLLAAKRKPV